MNIITSLHVFLEQSFHNRRKYQQVYMKIDTNECLLFFFKISWDMLWGGGQPFESKAYDDGTFDGVNQFGDMSTEWRDEQLALRKK